MKRRALGARWRRNERGALTPAVMVMAVSLLLLGGLVTDGGRALNGKLTAQAVAEEAARAGSFVDPFVATAVIDREKSVEAITTYCAQAMEENPEVTVCEPDGFGHDSNTDIDYVRVRVQVELPALLFGLIGVHTLESESTAQAAPRLGVEDTTELPFQPAIDPTAIYPPTTIDLPQTSGVGITNVPVPTEYTTSLCGTTTTLPLTVGLSCYTSVFTDPPPPPVGPTPTTVFTPFPTTVSPSYPVN